MFAHLVNKFLAFYGINTFFLLFYSLSSGRNHTKPIHFFTQHFKTHFNIALPFALGLSHSRLPTEILSHACYMSDPYHSWFHERVNRPIWLITQFSVAILLILKPKCMFIRI